MPEPIEWLVVQHVQTALRQIAIADGYHFNVGMAAVKLDPNQDVPALLAEYGLRPFIILELAPEAWTYYPANQVHIALPLTVHWVSDSVPTDDNSRLQTYLRGCADVERALAIDITRGGYAIDTRLVKRTFELALDGSQVWAAVELQIALQRTYGAPDA